MKAIQKKVLVVSLILCLTAILSAGTLAWFNAADEVTNTFRVADSDHDGTPDFSVDVWETDPSAPTVKDQDGVTYQNIAPGDVLAKNPTVENTGDYEQWIRVYVTFDEWAQLESACRSRGISSDLRDWLNVDPTAWEVDNSATSTTADSVTYVYYYNGTLAPDQTAVLFTAVAIPEEFVQTDMTFANGDFSVKVKAEALQAANTGDNAQKAFAACWSNS